MFEWAKKFIFDKVVDFFWKIFKKQKSENSFKKNSDNINKGQVMINGDGNNKVDLNDKEK